MYEFYGETLQKLVERNVLRHDMRILVVCAGMSDMSVVSQNGFENVVYSNLDERVSEAAFAPYKWSFQDAECLTFDDETFDFCIVHWGLHHCQSPHRALLEMYRVSKRGLVGFEPVDNLASRFAVRLGLGQQYEVAAVASNSCTMGGLKNTSIPNYVYRWTEREIEKTIQTHAPVAKHSYLYYYKFRLPWERAMIMNNPLLRLALRAVNPMTRLLSLALPRQCNNFAFVVLRPELPGDLHPWLTQANGEIQVDKDWIANRYRSDIPPEMEGWRDRVGCD
jgi:ubiquinone/menaquinone biosynthesis C-methylase UbiE